MDVSLKWREKKIVLQTNETVIWCQLIDHIYQKKKYYYWEEVTIIKLKKEQINYLDGKQLFGEKYYKKKEAHHVNAFNCFSCLSELIIKIHCFHYYSSLWNVLQK